MLMKTSLHFLSPPIKRTTHILDIVINLFLKFDKANIPEQNCKWSRVKNNLTYVDKIMLTYLYLTSPLKLALWVSVSELSDIGHAICRRESRIKMSQELNWGWVDSYTRSERTKRPRDRRDALRPPSRGVLLSIFTLKQNKLKYS